MRGWATTATARAMEEEAAGKSSDGETSAELASDSEVYSVVTDNFKKSAGPEAMKFMKNRIYPGTVMNSMLVYMTDNQAEGEDAAIEFMKKHEKVWSKWVSSSVAKKIKAGI